MKFDLAYRLSLDDKLSIYDMRDLNFDETVTFDSAKEHFQCPTMPRPLMALAKQRLRSCWPLMSIRVT